MTSIKGETIGRFRILSEIGNGGMGEVYPAQDTELDRRIAIKFLSDEFSNDTEKRPSEEIHLS